MRPLAPLALSLALSASALAWGDHGHELVNRAAARALPADVIECLRREARLTYLGPEPDRWRLGDLAEMNKAFAPDHFVDFEWCDKIDPDRPPPDRYAYAAALREAGRKPEQVGFAPYMVIELCQRIEAAVVAIELIDPAHPEAAERRKQAEEALVFVAGVLGHYVADLANPHHTTIHYNGWKGDNPEGFATDGGTHARFESVFVRRELERIRPKVVVTAAPRADLDYARAVWDLIRESNDQLRPLYRLDKQRAFVEGSDPTAGVDFAAQRMVRGATLLRDLWVTATRRGQRRAASQRVRQSIYDLLEEKGLDLEVRVDLDGKVTLRGKLDDPAVYERVVGAIRALPGAAEVRPRVRVLY